MANSETDNEVQLLTYLSAELVSFLLPDLSLTLTLWTLLAYEGYQVCEFLLQMLVRRTE